MNSEKIAEFTKQSGLDIILNEHAGEFGNGTVDSTYYPQVERFAELVVKECAGVCSNATVGKGTSDLVGRGFSEEIKLHFGVEL